MNNYRIIKKGKLKERLHHLTQLDHGWDSYGGIPVSHDAINAVDELMSSMFAYFSLNGLTIEWSYNDIEGYFFFNNRGILERTFINVSEDNYTHNTTLVSGKSSNTDFEVEFKDDDFLAFVFINYRDLKIKYNLSEEKEKITKEYENTLKSICKHQQYNILDLNEIESASKFLASVSFVPGSDGSLQIEWHIQGLDIEIDFSPKGRINAISIENANLKGYKNKILKNRTFRGKKYLTYLDTTANNELKEFSVGVLS